MESKSPARQGGAASFGVAGCGSPASPDAPSSDMVDRGMTGNL